MCRASPRDAPPRRSSCATASPSPSPASSSTISRILAARSRCWATCRCGGRGYDLINVVGMPEVSRVDPTNSVTIQGFNVPGLTTRRATTTVELRDGQSFAIAGLIQSDFQDTVRQFPVLGDVPVLGALLRSSDYQNAQTELVIIVTPHLVQPAPAGSLATPADHFVPPGDADTCARKSVV